MVKKIFCVDSGLRCRFALFCVDSVLGLHRAGLLGTSELRRAFMLVLLEKR
jgi:hypothetical protein